MQSIERSKVLAKKSHEDQLKYCILLEAGEIIRNLQNQETRLIADFNSSLPTKFRMEVSDANETTDAENSEADIPYEARQKMESALVQCNTNVIITIIGGSVSSKRAKSISCLSREYLFFYCVLFGVMRPASKMNSKEGMVCMLTDYFYTKLEQKYVKVQQSGVEDKSIIPESVENEVTPKKSQSERDSAQESTSENLPSTKLSLSECEDQPMKIRKTASATTLDSGAVLSEKPTKEALLAQYACYFEDALAMSPVLPLSSLSQFIEERTNETPDEAALQQVAQILHEMMQVVYSPSQNMLFLV